MKFVKGVQKTESEKDKFFNLIENLLDIGTQEKNVDINLINFLKKEINSCEEIKQLIPKDELKKELELNEKEKEKKELIPFKYSRWFISYNTEIDFKTEKNENFYFIIYLIV